MSTRSLWIFRGVEDRMRVVVTCSQAYLGAGNAPAAGRELNAGGRQRPIQRGSGSIDDRPCPR